MIKADDLREFRPIFRYPNGEGITLQTVQESIEDAAEKMGIPVDFYPTDVKSGGRFKPTFEDCLIMFHPDHQFSYFRFCIRVKRQGVYAFVSVNEFGESEQMKKSNLSEFMQNDRKGKDMVYKVSSMIGQGIRTLGVNKQKLEDEINYYQCILDLFDEIIS